jgi:hypothetical protein
VQNSLLRAPKAATATTKIAVQIGGNVRASSVENGHVP